MADTFYFLPKKHRLYNPFWNHYDLADLQLQNIIRIPDISALCQSFLHCSPCNISPGSVLRADHFTSFVLQHHQPSQPVQLPQT